MQSRAWRDDAAGRREAIRFATLDSNIALVLALLVNASILITAAATFHQAGHTDIAEIGDAYRLIAPLLGSVVAAKLFALALLLSGLNATVTATMAGQVVMEGFLRLRIPPVARRLLTRLLAIVPAVLVTWRHGESATAGLLVLSQVVLSAALPFALVPLMLFAGDRRRLGALAAPRWQVVLGWGCVAVILALNGVLLWDAG